MKIFVKSYKSTLCSKNAEGKNSKYGTDKLSQVDPASYKALLAEVEGLTDDT